MRTKTLAVLLLGLTPAFASDWSADLDASLAKAAKEKKPVVVDISADG